MANTGTIIVMVIAIAAAIGALIIYYHRRFQAMMTMGGRVKPTDMDDSKYLKIQLEHLNQGLRDFYIWAPEGIKEEVVIKMREKVLSQMQDIQNDYIAIGKPFKDNQDSD